MASEAGEAKRGSHHTFTASFMFSLLLISHFRNSKSSLVDFSTASTSVNAEEKELGSVPS